MTPPSLPKAISDVLAEQTRRWMQISDVVGTAIGEFEHEPCLIVFVRRNTCELAERIPDRVEGYRVVLRSTGNFRAL